MAIEVPHARRPRRGPHRTSWHALTWRWRTRAFRRRPSLPAIFLYHSVGDRARDPLRLALPPALFEEQVAWIARETTPLTLQEFTRRLSEGTLPPRATAVTFDDGYRDNLTRAEPILARYRVPATVFVTTDLVGVQHEPWWEELDALLLESPSLPGPFHSPWGDFPVESLKPEGRDGWCVLEPPGSDRERSFLALSRVAKGLPESERRELMKKLRSWAGGAAIIRPGREFPGWDDWAQTVRRGTLSVGAHTRSHPCLSLLAPAEQEEEIAGSVHELRTRLGIAVEAFAYPFGTWEDFSPLTRRLVAQSGLSVGLANMAARPQREPRPTQLPRCLMGSWTAQDLSDRFLR